VSENRELSRKWQRIGVDCVMRSFINLYASPNIIRMIKSEDEMGKACNMLWRDNKCIQKFEQMEEILVSYCMYMVLTMLGSLKYIQLSPVVFGLKLLMKRYKSLSIDQILTKLIKARDKACSEIHTFLSIFAIKKKSM
jgi:hypothetical protein